MRIRFIYRYSLLNRDWKCHFNLMDLQTDGLRGNIHLEPIYIGRSFGKKKSEERTLGYRNDIDRNLIPDLIKPKRKMCLSQLTHNLFLDYLNAGKYN